MEANGVFSEYKLGFNKSISRPLTCRLIEAL